MLAQATDFGEGLLQDWEANLHSLTYGVHLEHVGVRKGSNIVLLQEVLQLGDFQVSVPVHVEGFRNVGGTVKAMVIVIHPHPSVYVLWLLLHGRAHLCVQIFQGPESFQLDLNAVLALDGRGDFLAALSVSEY